MRDREVVASIVAGDPDGLAAAYDRYAPQLLGYCRSLLREPADAADAVQDTFVIAASRLKDLRDPDHLRPWLYTVARNSCLRKLKAEKVAAAIYPAAPGVAGAAAEVGVRAELAELRALVRDASAGLTTRDREVLVLRLWQGMDPGEAASVLGVSRSYGNALFSRACAHLEICIGVLLVARTGEKECTRLAALLQDWDGHLDVLLRKRLSRHIDHCATCSQRRRHELVPALLGLSAGAAIAGAAAADAARQAAHMPVALKGQVLTAATKHIAAPAGAAAHAAGAGAAAGTGAAGAHGAGAGAAGAGAAVAHGAAAGAAGMAAAGAGEAAAHAADVPLPAHAGAGGAEGAISGSEPVSFGKDGLPKPARTGGRVTRAQVTAAGGGVAAAAVIVTAIALTLSGGPHQGKLSSSSTSGIPGIPGTAGASSQGVTPGSSLPGATGPGSGPGLRSPGRAGTGSAGAGVPSVGVLGGGTPQPTAGGAPSSGSSSASGNPGSGSSPSSGAPTSGTSPSSGPPSTKPPAPGTLSVSTQSILLDLGGSSTLTLTAHGGPVAWSISVPSTVLGDLSVSKTSGTLAAGKSTTVTISVIGLVSLGTTLDVDPGGTPVTVVIGLG